MSDDDDYGYEDDFDERLADEFTTREEAEEEVGRRVRSPSPTALMAARLSVLGSELTRKLDATLRPSTGAGMRASIDVSASQGFGSRTAAGASVGASLGASLRPPSSSVDIGLIDSSRSVRQSQDLFAALDLANTDAALKEQYTRYWDAVEEQEQAQARRQQRHEAALRQEEEADEAQEPALEAEIEPAHSSHHASSSSHTHDVASRRRPSHTAAAAAAAEQKHLARLKAKMAATKEAAAASAAARQEQGWDSGFAFGREAAPRSPRARPTFDRPSVVKASAALAQFMSSAAASGITINAPASASASPPFASSLLGKRASPPASAGGALVSGVPANAKPLPPAPGGVVDPARIRSVVQTRMPAIVLAKLAASRRAASQGNRAASATVARATKRTRAISAVSSKANLFARRGSATSSLATSARDDDDEEEIVFELSPKSTTSSTTATASTKSRSSQAQQPQRHPSAAKIPTASALARPAPTRSSSAGVKPTNASMLLAAERAAQLNAPPASTVPDGMKQVPIAQWNRLRREVEDLRRKVVALETENDLLRRTAQTQAQDASQPTRAASRVSSAASRPALGKTLSAGNTAATRSAASAALSKTTSVQSTMATTTTTGPKPTGLNLGFKLNLAGLVGDEDASPLSPTNELEIDLQEDEDLGLDLDLEVDQPLRVSVPLTPSKHGLMSPRARCAVSGCGTPRASGKPYCLAHLSTNAPSTTAAAAPLASARDQPSALTSARASARLSATEAAAAAPSVSPPTDIENANSRLTPPISVFGMHGLNLNLGSNTKKYDYDYESDDNYGGTDDDDDDESFMSMDGPATDRSVFTVHSSAAGGGESARASDGNTARAANERASLQAPPSARATQRDVAISGAVSQRGKSDSSLVADASTAASVVVAPAPSARDRVPTSARPNTLLTSATPRIVHPASTRGIDVRGGARGLGPNASVGRSGGLFDLESLRSSPYAGVDGALNGSFEITQSGTFKRGGFALNRQGMTTPSGATNVGSTAGSNAFQWDAPPTSRVGAQSHRSSSSVSSVSSGASPSTSFRSLNAADIYTLGVLGRGSSGVVYRAFHAPTLELFAVKAIGVHEQDKRRQLTQELRTLTLAPSAHTIGFRGAYFDAQHCYIALEYMDMGSLDDLRESSGTVAEHELAFIFEQVLDGLKHLESAGIMHRDIKPHNILYNARGEFKLTDFGIISDWKDRDAAAAMAEAKTFVGTLLYMSPERIGGQAYSYSCDIWSMALALLTCRVGTFAIPHNSHWELVNAIQSGPDILNAYSPEQVSDSLRDLLKHCLATNPLSRPTADECLRHPFFARYRVNGPNQPIPIPARFPPPRAKPSDASTDGLSEKEARRAARSEEIERRNERHMLEQVCALVASRGLTTRNRSSAAPLNTTNTTPPPLPMDERLCARITERLAALLQVQPATVRAILVQAHNRHVGYMP